MRSFATPMKVWMVGFVAALAASALIPSTGNGQSRSVTPLRAPTGYRDYCDGSKGQWIQVRQRRCATRTVAPAEPSLCDSRGRVSRLVRS